MDNNSDTTYLIQLKKMLIDEIKVLETTVSNESFLSSLPIQSEEVQHHITKYNSTNNYVDFDKTLSEKRKSLTAVNLTLRNMCNHKIITGDLKLSYKKQQPVNYCILCMNFF